MNELFDQEIKSLFTQSLEILNQRYGVSTQLGVTKKEITCLNRYKAIYDETSPEDHTGYFLKLFNTKKFLILKTLDNDTWLKHGNIVIQLGEDIDEYQDKFKNIKIMLSKIYNCAIELQESALKTSSGLSQLATAQNKDLIRPSIILLHLMRLFYAVAADDDKKKLSSIIDTLENDLQVKNKTIKPVGPQGLLPGVSGATLAPIFDMAKTLMKNFNIPGSDDLECPDDKQLIEGLNMLMENDVAKNAFETVATSIKNKDDFKTTATTFLNKMLDPDSMEGLKSSLLKTAEIARENTQK